MTAESAGGAKVADVPARSPLETFAAHALLQRIAWKPRLAGTASEREAREVCADRLRSQGFDVVEQPFAFSEFPGRWAPILGAVGLGVVAFGSSEVTIVHSAPFAGLSILLAGFAMLAAVGGWLVRHGTSRFPWLRSESVNLVATRGAGHAATARTWLVAHMDSKSQTIPMAARIAGAVLSAVMLTLLAGAIITRAFVDGASSVELVNTLVRISFWLTCVSLIPMALCIVANKSAGALDNGSGVAAVLMAARKIDAGRPIGVIITSGEELGLAGARAYVSANPGRGIALNCDTIDDQGSFVGMMHGSPYKSGLAQAVTRAAARCGTPIRIGRMLPGVLADNIAFSDTGWDSLTLSRGNLATLSRVHTAGDRPDKIDGSGIAEAARLIAATIEELS